ncbi:MAG TPA: serine hydrolase domain-containing protein [Blastocatellia bacterium]|nr:serine hydrolase domain-containing protein [Blastocatellia bacterium]
MLKRLIALTVVFFFLFFAGLALSDDGNEAERANFVVAGELGRRLDEYLTRASEFGFSGTVLVARGGEIALHKGYGLADQKAGVPATTRTVYDVASITKQFTSAAILRLEKEGRLKTGDPITKFFKDVPADKAAITLHHLMTHTSGLAAVLEGEKPVTRDEFIKGMLAGKLQSRPGERYSYSNAGYTLAAAVIEIVSGKSFEAFLTEQLFKPAGMTDTGFYEDEAKWEPGLVAHGYNESVDKGAPNSQRKDYRFRGSSYVITTTGDLYKWEVALKGDKILDKDAKQKWLAPHAPTGQPRVAYGYGWAVSETPRKSRLVSHDGISFQGFNSIFHRYVDEDTVVIVASNTMFGRFMPTVTLQPDLWAIIFGGKARELPVSAALAPEAVGRYGGTYEFASGARLYVEAEGKRLKIAAEGQEALDYLSDADVAKQRLHAELNRRGEAVFKAMAAGDFTPFVEEFRGRVPADQIKQMAERLWARWQEQHGRFKSLELLGTVSETEAAQTYFRINFERASEVRRCRWEQGRLAYILQATLPLIPTVFVPQSETVFAGFNLGLARVVKLEFAVDDKRAVTGLIFENGSGRSIARRK